MRRALYALGLVLLPLIAACGDSDECAPSYGAFDVVWESVEGDCPEGELTEEVWVREEVGAFNFNRFDGCDLVLRGQGSCFDEELDGRLHWVGEGEYEGEVTVMLCDERGLPACYGRGMVRLIRQ